MIENLRIHSTRLADRHTYAAQARLPPMTSGLRVMRSRFGKLNLLDCTLARGKNFSGDTATLLWYL